MKESLSVALNNFCKLILAIENDGNNDPDWRRFYQIQMYSYLLSREDFIFRLDEAEKEYEAIVDSWNDFKKYLDKPLFRISDVDNLYFSIAEMNVDFK